jgi:hypothetical protein
MPIKGSMSNIIFCAISCNSVSSDGAWEALGKFVDDSRPHFILMMGDQVYADEDGQNIFLEFVDSPRAVRRKALAEKYRANWSRKPVRHVLANVPIYMMWDDHDIRDGWGTLASDSQTLVEKYPHGKEIFRKCMEYFDDARDVYWHFQASHNSLVQPPTHTQRRAMPYSFQCGRLMVLMLDSRGDRDVFRKEFPILGLDQWDYINGVFDNLADDVDALVIMTPTPIASLDPNGQVQKLMGKRTDDVESFKKGNFEELFHPRTEKGGAAFLEYIARYEVRRFFGNIVDEGFFQASNVDEARDQWSHEFSHPEQLSLLDAARNACITNRNTSSHRALVFLSGDIHIGCIFDITYSNPKHKAISLTSSGISTVVDVKPTIGALIEEDFDVGRGIHSTLRDVVTDFNFGVIQVNPTGTAAEIIASLAHKGNSFVVGLDISSLL